MEESIGEASGTEKCLDRQDKLFAKIVNFLDVRDDMIEIKRVQQTHDNRIVAMDNRLMVLEAASLTSAENTTKILKHFDNAPTPEQYQTILGYIEKIETGKTKFVKWYIIGSLVIMLGAIAGIPYGDLIKAVIKAAVKTL